MKIVTFNVNGLRAILKKNFVMDFDHLDADIFALNETKISDENAFPFSKEGYFLYHRESKIRKGYSGVAIYTKRKPLSVHYGLEDGKYDDEGRVITLEFKDFYFVCCYVPNSGEALKRLAYRMEFEENMRKYLKKLDSEKPVIYGGDLNVAPQEIDVKNAELYQECAGFTWEERHAFQALLNLGFFDVYRYFYPEKIAYTWWSYKIFGREKNIGWRIDHFLISERLLPKVKKIEIHSEIMGSDHCPVSLELSFS